MGLAGQEGYADQELREVRLSMDAETYLSERLEPQLAWLSRTSRSNKQAYLRYRMLGIVLGAGITILSPYSDRKITLNGIALVPLVLQICGAGVALSGALLALNQHQENWMRYRNLKEALEREKWLYITGSSKTYSGADAFHRFVCNAEAMMGEERSAWLNQVSEADAKSEVAEALEAEKLEAEKLEAAAASALPEIAGTLPYSLLQNPQKHNSQVTTP